MLYFIGVLFRSRESLERERAALRRQIKALQAEEGAGPVVNSVRVETIELSGLAYGPKTRPTESEDGKRTPGWRTECVDSLSIAVGIGGPPTESAQPTDTSTGESEPERSGLGRGSCQVRVT